MSSQILSPRIAALAIVGLVLAGVAGLVGTDENEGALSHATQTLADKARGSTDAGQAPPARPDARPAPSPARYTQTAAPAAPPSPANFADDESLIDDASGYDPSPVADDPAEGAVVAVVAEDDEAGEAEAGPAVIEGQEP